jgi:hypothetical protein
MNVYYTHCILPTCFDHSHGHLQGCALQSRPTDTLKYYKVLEQIHRYKMLNFKKNTYFKLILKIKIQIKIFLIDSDW